MSMDGDYERRLDIRRSIVQEEIRGREVKLGAVSAEMKREERRAEIQHHSFQRVYQRVKARTAAGRPHERLEESRQLVDKLRARKAALSEVQGRIHELSETKQGMARELQREELRLEKIVVLRDEQVAVRARMQDEQIADELMELASAVRDEPMLAEVVPDMELASLPRDVHDTPLVNVLPVADGTPVLTPSVELLGERSSGHQPRDGRDVPDRDGGPSGESAAQRFDELQGRVQDVEQWKRLGSEGVSLRFTSSTGSEFNVSVVEREGVALDVVIQAARAGDARSLRRARDEIEQQIRQAGLTLRTLEVR